MDRVRLAAVYIEVVGVQRAGLCVRRAVWMADPAADPEQSLEARRDGLSDLVGSCGYRRALLRDGGDLFEAR